ncbi:MAG: hypothetical protein ACREB3_09650, partial [Burkholderiales bacterium]
MFKRLHDTVPDSLKLGRISDFAFRCWTVGLSQSDWHGRLPAEPEKFIVQCFPNRREITPELVKSALDELAEVMGEGLIHLYKSADGKQYLVFHRHKKHNAPSTHPRTTSDCPPPPKGLCVCVTYAAAEGQGPFGGREFRFYPNLFERGGASSIPDGGLESEKLPNGSSACHVAQACADSRRRVQQKDVSSPLLSSPLGGGVGEGGFDLISSAFLRLTGEKGWKSIRERQAIELAMQPSLVTRGAPALVAVMEARIKPGQPPSSLRYFIPVFNDPSVFEVAQDAELRELAALAEASGIGGGKTQILKRLDGWRRQPGGAARVRDVLRHPDSIGVDVLALQDRWFNGSPGDRPFLVRRRQADPNCTKCNGKGQQI